MVLQNFLPAGASGTFAIRDSHQITPNLLQSRHDLPIICYNKFHILPIIYYNHRCPADCHGSEKRPRLQFLDTGLLNQAAGLQGKMIGVRDLNDFYRGKIIQHLVTQQLIAIHDQPSYRPHFWVREEGATTSEVDLVMQHELTSSQSR